jgi:putative component of membrane protein insertase Oxa1/YidC/SpoIIIJ protein YidD
MKFVIFLIRLYQRLSHTLIAYGVFAPISGCRQWPTCSEFAVHAITTRGIISGTTAAFQRVARCNPRISSTSHVH